VYDIRATQADWQRGWHVKDNSRESSTWASKQRKGISVIACHRKLVKIKDLAVPIRITQSAAFDSNLWPPLHDEGGKPRRNSF
jgi:hypothetical protein